MEKDPTSSSSAGPTLSIWEDVANDFKTFHGGANALIAPGAVLEEVKVAQIGSDGLQVGDTIIIDLVDTPGGSPDTAFYPTILPQSALVISLDTDRRGPTGKGRFYLPMPVVGIDAATLLLPTTTAELARNWAKTLIDNINNVPGIDAFNLQVVVASSKGYNTRVTGVRCGRVVDTMRSRRAQLNESYAPAAVIA
jgi:hypothetical protein